MGLWWPGDQAAGHSQADPPRSLARSGLTAAAGASESEVLVSAIEVRSFPRIHVTLIDLGGATQRRFGGAGFALDAMPAVVKAFRDKECRVEGAPNLRGRDRKDLELYVRRLSNAMERTFRVQVQSVMQQHVGLGSKTALLLAAGLACNAVGGMRLQRDTLVGMSGRGGASGVGVNVAFDGGFVVDGGHKASVVNDSFRPSSACESAPLPPQMVRLEFPKSWRVHLFLPRGRRYSGESERRFFSENTPIDVHEVREVMAAVYHGVAPAVAEGDLEALRTALRAIHGVGFKRRELMGQGQDVRELLDLLWKHVGAAAGMSSLGPLVYAITKDGEGADVVRDGMTSGKGVYLGTWSGRNRGHDVLESGG